MKLTGNAAIQRSADWFEIRKKKICASDCAPILGISPFKNVHDVYMEKTSPFVDVAYVNAAMKRGQELEPIALQAFEKETGYLMSPAVFTSDSNPWQLASLDGYEMDGKAAVEIKAPNIKVHEDAIYGKIPVYYYAQVQHQIEVTGLDKIYYCSYHPDSLVKQLYIEEIYRDEEFIANMMQKETAFYLEHLLPVIPPENKPKAKRIETHQWITLTDEYKKLDNINKNNSQRQDEIKDLLIQLADAEPACGNGLSLSKVERKGAIPYTSIPEVRSLDLEKHRKPSTTFWTLREIER